MITLRDVVDRKLGKVIAVRAGQHLLEVSQTGHHGHNMILDIAKIESNVHTRSDLIICVASLRKASQDVCFATEEFHQTHHVLANHSNLPEETMHIIISSDENLILNKIGLLLNLGDNGRKRIDNVITVDRLAN